jgi:hypothetical protein
MAFVQQEVINNRINSHERESGILATAKYAEIYVMFGR